ncbi:CDP-glycerol glycerophosphotransferase family protein [Microbacterium sp. LTA6]|uniref:CDP-glycerol glycerophosphotransferase family protein n=1 Tax=unclassified Microbacterium TaxID=2609290 RepID=UPI00313979B4
MGAVSDATKAYRLLRRALVSRSAVQRVRRRLQTDGPLPVAHFKVAVYFADGAVNMYQMRQWYRPLAELAKRWPVVVISRNATGAEKLLEEEGAPPITFVPTVRDLEKFIAKQDIRVVLYVNQNTRNFQMFRYGRRWHVFINHGESDKMYMTTNQYKAYDYAFVAGQAARDRLSRTLWNYDIDARTIEIGRPQADHYSGTLPYTPDERTVVLYAPTWEGDRPSAHYGSIATHGEALVTALLSTGTHRVIYRPHPRSGVVDEEYGAAHRRIIAAVAAANVADATAQHVYDNGPDLGWQLASADVAIVDISAMVYDRLAAGKPLMITRPADERASVDTTGYLADCEWLTTDAAADIVAEVERVGADAEAIARLQMWVQHYFGDTTPGVASEKFHGAIERLMQEWDEWHEHEMGSIRSDEDDDDEEADEEEI